MVCSIIRTASKTVQQVIIQLSKGVVVVVVLFYIRGLLLRGGRLL